MNLFHSQKDLFAIFAITFLACIVFFNIFGNAFIWDDQQLIVENPHIQSLKSLPFLFSPSYWKYHAPEVRGWYRPARVVTLTIDYFFWKRNPFGYHLTNTLLHAANSIFVYFLTGLLTATMVSRTKIKEGGRGWPQFFEPAFVAAALFAVHPMHVESVAWIKNRSDLLALFFFLVSFLLFARFLARGGWFFSLASIGAMFAAFCSKEMGLVMPLVLFSYVVFFVPSGRRRRAAAVVGPMFVLAFLYFIFGRSIVPATSAPPAYPMNVYIHCLAVLKTYAYYIRLVCVPVGLNAARFFGIPRSFVEPGVFFSIGTLLIAAFAFLSVVRKSRPAAFAILWFFITLLPVSNILFLEGRPIAEQRLYIPSVGFCIFSALAIYALACSRMRLTSRVKGPQLASVVFISLLIWWGTTTVMRNFDWKDSITFWSKTVRQSPWSSRALYNLGTAYVYQGDFARAAGLYEQSLARNPSSLDALNNLGNIYYQKGDFEKAIGLYRAAFAVDPRSLETYNNLGAAYQAVNRSFEAANAYQEAITIDPDDPAAYNNLGTLYEAGGKTQEAIAVYKKAVVLKRASAEVFFNLGVSYCSAGQYAQGLEAFAQAIARNPAFAQAYNNMAVVYYYQRDYDRALSTAEKAETLGLRNEELFQALEALGANIQS
ncbi:MAG: tetratricopeptide repeat protein [Candidatus Omnitrophota bacterium]